METITSTKELISPFEQHALIALQNHPLTKFLPLEKLCFFDIETTGLSADISSVYLIGCCYFATLPEESQTSKNQCHIIQWFADDYCSEKDLLLSFSKFIENFDTIIHYNGTGFDIPYLKKKYAFYHLSNPFFSLLSIDFYKLLRKFKNHFLLENLKLKTIENFLCIHRNDSFSGKDCITLYSNYMQMKYFREEEKKKACRYSLLLHNYDDIIGTFLCSQILLYLLPFSDEGLIFDTSVNQQYLFIETCLPCTVPTSFSSESIEPFFTYKKNSFQMKLPLITCECYYFFKDYKNYFYLPAEDEAIHRSVACFVDSNHREKATSKNCYTKKKGTFLPVMNFKKTDNEFLGVPLFFDKTKEHAYIEWTKFTSTWQTEKRLSKYLESLL